ncbi:MAG: NAD(P)/FAD-dependent oxidoreductase [Elainellaceae cyanobacterium]
MFDYAVIGKGLIGSSAGRSLAQSSSRVAIIGPDEPSHFASHAGIFASHYDQGRITRILDADWIWGTLAKRSIHQYADIEADSGISFHHPVGALRVGHNTPDRIRYITQNKAVGQTLQATFQDYSRSELQQQFPYFSFASDSIGLYETGGAGFINPRGLIQAQLQCAQQRGATVIREIAKDISLEPDRCIIHTQDGSRYDAQKVLVTTGAFTNFFSLIQRPLDLKPVAESILLAELSESSLQAIRAPHGHATSMPSLMYQFPDEHHDDRMLAVYMVPPVEFPDGKTYLKIGVGSQRDRIFDSLENLTTWFKQGPDPATHDHIHALLTAIMPELEIVATHVNPCVLTYTPTNYPFIDVIKPDRVFVATGGCGYAGKSSVEIGAIAARLTRHGTWVEDLDANLFKARWR